MMGGSRKRASGLRVLGRGYEEKDGDEDQRLTRVLSATKTQTELLGRRLSADSPFARECSERLARELDVNESLQRYREQRKAQGGSPVKTLPSGSDTKTTAVGADSEAAGEEQAVARQEDKVQAPPIFGLTSLLSQSSRDEAVVAAEESYREQKLRDEIIRFQKRLKRRLKTRSRTMTMDLQGFSNLPAVADSSRDIGEKVGLRSAPSDRALPLSLGTRRKLDQGQFSDGARSDATSRYLSSFESKEGIEALASEAVSRGKEHRSKSKSEEGQVRKGHESKEDSSPTNVISTGASTCKEGAEDDEHEVGNQGENEGVNQDANEEKYHDETREKASENLQLEEILPADVAFVAGFSLASNQRPQDEDIRTGEEEMTRKAKMLTASNEKRRRRSLVDDCADGDNGDDNDEDDGSHDLQLSLTMDRLRARRGRGPSSELAAKIAQTASEIGTAAAVGNISVREAFKMVTAEDYVEKLMNDLAQTLARVGGNGTPPSTDKVAGGDRLSTYGRSEEGKEGKEDEIKATAEEVEGGIVRGKGETKSEKRSTEAHEEAVDYQVTDDGQKWKGGKEGHYETERTSKRQATPAERPLRTPPLAPRPFQDARASQTVRLTTSAARISEESKLVEEALLARSMPSPSRRKHSARELTPQAHVQLAPSSESKHVPQREDAKEEKKTRKRRRRIEYIRVLGRGASGKVYLARMTDILDDETGEVKELVAIKQLVGNGTHNSRDLGHVLRAEVNMLKTLSHPNIVGYRGVHFSKRKSQHCILMEYCDAGSIADALRKSPTGYLARRVLKSTIEQVLNGLAYLHHQGVIHRDLKPANILMTTSGHVKIADFDISTQVSGLQTQQRSCVGTPSYTAPEVILVQPYSTKADIWSLGCSVLEMATGARPYAKMNPIQAMYHMVENKHPPIATEHLSRMDSDLLELLLSTFKREPRERPTAVELLSFDYLTKFSGRSGDDGDEGEDYEYTSDFDEFESSTEGCSTEGCG